MCGIAGIVGLDSTVPPRRRQLKAMADAIIHRGPDDDGYFLNSELGIGLAARRLSIVGVDNGQQPVFNEDRTVVAVYNGELFDHRTLRRDLVARGHRFRTDADSEVLVHLWEEHGENLFNFVDGQFAFALCDLRRGIVILARDRFGICPLHWTRQNGKLYFGSEVKAILASGDVNAEPDLRGVDQILTMFALPTRRTMFKDVQAVYPGHYLKLMVRPGENQITENPYWDLDFPDEGDEKRPANNGELVNGLRDVFYRAVETRLQADVPVAAYLSGGVDSAVICAAATDILDRPIHAFSIKIDSPFFDEERSARRNADAIGCQHTVVTCDSTRLLDRYRQLVVAAESPVVDTSCAALHLLSETLAQQGYKVTLTGEGADEALAGYPWFKTNKLLNLFDFGAFRPGEWARWAIGRIAVPYLTEADRQRILSLLGGTVAQADLYGMVSANRRRILSENSQAKLGDYCAFEDLELNYERMKRWHPLNRSLYVGYKTQLSGMLLSQKSDRVAMANSVEARYPFLDERVVEFCAGVAPEWKLKGVLKDKYVLRQMARGCLPDEAALRPKKMFRAPFSDTVFSPQEPFVQQLLCKESIDRAGYFDAAEVEAALKRRGQKRWPYVTRCFDEMTLVAVFATQLWHHQFIDSNLCESITASATDRLIRTDVPGMVFDNKRFDSSRSERVSEP